MENICNAHDCNNVIKGRRSDSKYCSNYCGNKMKRHRRNNGMQGAAPVRNYPINKSGDLIGDLAQGISQPLMDFNNSNPIPSMGQNVVRTLVPECLEMIKKHPFRSLFLLGGGYLLGNSIFGGCETTTTTDSKGKKQTSETCKKASGLQKTGTSVGTLFLVNTVINSVKEPVNQNIGGIATGSNTGSHTGYRRGNKGNTVYFEQSAS